MITIDEGSVARVLRLCGLELKKEELVEMRAQLSNILKHMEALKGIDVELVEPSFLGCNEGLSLREDEAIPFDHKEILKMTPYIDGDQYLVPNVIDGDQ